MVFSIKVGVSYMPECYVYSYVDTIRLKLNLPYKPRLAISLNDQITY